MSVLKVKNGNQWDIVPAIKGDTGDPAADESITDAMLVPDGIKTEIDWLWGNQLMDSREGELLQTDDAYEAPLVSLDVDGKSTQVVTTGKNLVDPDKMANGYIDTSGAVIGSTNTYKHSDYIPVTSGITYTVSQGGVAFSGAIRYVFYDSEKVFIPPYYAHGNATNFQLTAPEGASYFRASFNGPQSAYAMVEEGTNYTGFEPYTGGKPSPSPDYPQPIVSVDELGLMLSGMNIFDKVYASDQSNWRVATYRSIGWYVGVGVPVTFSYENAKVANLLSNSSVYFGPRQGTASGNNIMFNPNHHETSKAETVIAGANGYVYLNVYPNSEAAVTACLATVADVLQIEVGTTAHSYAPYTKEISTVTLYDGTLRSLPNGTKDELHLSYLRPSTREGWAWYDRELVKRTHDTAFSDLSAKGWAKSDSATNGFYLNCANFEPAMKASVENGVMSDVATAVNSASVWNTTMNAMFVGNSFNIQFDASLVGSTATAFKSWLATSDATLVYPLATPITTQLDPIELPIMPSKDTTIWSDPSAQLKMTYIQDTNLVIESLEATVADMATS